MAGAAVPLTDPHTHGKEQQSLSQIHMIHAVTLFPPLLTRQNTGTDFLAQWGTATNMIVFAESEEAFMHSFSGALVVEEAMSVRE